jgi:hypothetical protein
MGSPVRIEITFSQDRISVGQLQVFNDAGAPALGPVDCLGRADAQDAKLHGNPERNSTLPFGDTPVGKYSLVRLVSHSGSESDSHTYGDYPSLLLDPISGDALKAKKNGRFGLMIHGGAPSGTAKLRPTHGCVRVSEDNQRDLVAVVVQSALGSSTATITNK